MIIIFSNGDRLFLPFPKIGKNILNESDGLLNPPKIQHVLQLSRPLPIQKLTSKQLYILLIHKIKKKPTSQIKISQKTDDFNIDWSKFILLDEKLQLTAMAVCFISNALITFYF